MFWNVKQDESKDQSKKLNCFQFVLVDFKVGGAFFRLMDRNDVLEKAYKDEEDEKGKTVMIHQVAVDAKCRRRTIASQLIEACCKKGTRSRCQTFGVQSPFETPI